MEVKVIRSYTDKELNRNMQIGDVIDVTNERATVTNRKRLCSSFASWNNWTNRWRKFNRKFRQTKKG